MRNMLFVSLLLLLLSGCTYKTAYRNLDWMLTRYLESYVEFTDEQKRELSERLDDTMYWHQATQLPLYADWLQRVRADLQAGLSQEQVAQYAAELMDYWRVLMSRFADDMAVILPGLDSQQRDELFASFSKKNDEYREEYVKVSLDDLQSVYEERLEDNFERWLGSLNSEQESMIRTAARELYPVAREALRARMHWQAELQRVLGKHRDAAATDEALQTLFVDARSLRSESYQHKLDHNRQLLNRLIADISASLTEKQRQYLFKRIDKYIRMFTELAEEAKPLPAGQCVAC